MINIQTDSCVALPNAFMSRLTDRQLHVKLCCSDGLFDLSTIHCGDQQPKIM